MNMTSQFTVEQPKKRISSAKQEDGILIVRRTLRKTAPHEDVLKIKSKP